MAVKTYREGDRTLLTKYICANDFRCGLSRGCSCTTILIDLSLVAYIRRLEDHFGCKITITSAYRCPSYNAGAGGVTKSYHTRGMAIDFVVPGHSPREAAQYCESIGIKGIGLYETRADGYFVHIDTRTVKAFWYGQAQAKRTTFGSYTPAKPQKPTGPYTREQFIRDVQRAIGARVDGIAGPETLNMTPTLAAWRNISHPAVLPVQRYLQSLGYNVGAPDGVAGPKFTAAVKQYQADTGCKYRDGELTSKKETWKKMLGL